MRFVFSNGFSENPVVCEIMWKNVEWGRPQMAWCMHTACWIAKATNTHSEYLILNAFPMQPWLQESAPTLGYTYISRLVT
jgi:hypothetical protein